MFISIHALETSTQLRQYDFVKSVGEERDESCLNYVEDFKEGIVDIL
jgi:hypothetical protein